MAGGVDTGVDRLPEQPTARGVAASGSAITGSRIARNAALSLGGAIAPAIVAILAMPFVIRGLGTEAFGVLSIAWVLLGIFAVLDFGASRATTRRVAEYTATGHRNRLGAVIWTALLLNAGLALVTGGLLAAASGFLAERILDVPAALRREAAITFCLLGAVIPATLATGVLRSALEGAHRFDVTTLIQVPANALNFLWPALVVAFGGGLVAVVVCICLTRVVLAPVFFAACRRQFGGLGAPAWDREEARFLLRFGSWLTVSSVIGPILLHLDRLLVGSMLGVRSVAFYAAPYEMVTRLTLIPASLMAALFPALSGFAAGDRGRFAREYGRALRQLLVIMVPICSVLVAFAPEILTAWLGAEFAAHGASAVRLLAIGLLALSISSLPFNALQAIGRADAAAKIHAMELVPYALLAWVAVAQFGIVGAAAAWSLRCVVDGLLFHAAARRAGVDARRAAGTLRTMLLLGGFAAVTLLLGQVGRAASAPPLVVLACVAALGLLYTVLGWRYILEPEERAKTRELLRRRGPRSARADA